MGNSLSDSTVLRHETEKAVTPVHVLVLLSLAFGASVWGASFIFGPGPEGLQLQTYLAVLSFYGAAGTL